MPDSEAPTCPFCGVHWNRAMIEQLDRHSSGASCACCAGPLLKHIAIPSRDLCCHSCGKPIYKVAER